MVGRTAHQVMIGVSPHILISGIAATQGRMLLPPCAVGLAIGETKLEPCQRGAKERIKVEILAARDREAPIDQDHRPHPLRV